MLLPHALRCLKYTTTNSFRGEEEEMALVKQADAEGEDMIIKPEAVTPAVDTSGWPLLLRNWDQREYLWSLLCDQQTLTAVQYSFGPATSHPYQLAAHL